MGYYIAVPCRDRHAREKMRAFLKEHYRPPQELMPWMDQDRGTLPLPDAGRNICVYAKANELGWYRNAGWEEEDCAFGDCLLRWMALKIGRTMTTRDDEIPGYGPLEVHYTIYEGDPKPFVLRSMCPDVPDGWDADGYVVCDDLGWDRSMRGLPIGEDPEEDAALERDHPHLYALRVRKTKADPIIRAELKHLEALWVLAQSLQSKTSLLRPRRDYLPVGRKPLLVEPLPDGHLPTYDDEGEK